MSIPVLQSYQKNNGLASSTLTCSKPGGVQAGDLLVLICTNDENGNTQQFTDNKTGWNFLGNNGNSTSDCHAGAFWKIADGGEGSQESVTSEAAQDWTMYYLRITGHHATTPIDNSYFSQTPFVGNSCTFDSYSTNNDNCLVIAATGFDGADGYPFSLDPGSTQWAIIDQDHTTNGSSGASGVYATLDQASAGSVQTLDIDSSASDGWAPFMISIRESAATDITISNAIAEAIATTVAPTVVQTYDEIDDIVLEWTTSNDVTIDNAIASAIAAAARAESMS